MSTPVRTLLLTLLSTVALVAQVDPGPRPTSLQGPPLVGGPLPNLPASLLDEFNEVKDVFSEESDVAKGLGPRFNGNSCGGCHIHPVLGGSSPAANPQPAMATKNGAINIMPPFIQADGPIRVARRLHGPDGRMDGGVFDLFTIAGRSDAPDCRLPQNNFSNLQNFRFRIPTPTFGLGLVEAIADRTLADNLLTNPQRRQQLHIRGRLNTNGNDGTVTRFGWKAQNKSLLIFAGEAYHVEQGVTNELFPNERDATPGCGTQTHPEDHGATPGSPGDLGELALFMRLLDQPKPFLPANPDEARRIADGRQAFNDVGCAVCHTPTLKTAKSTTPGLSEVDVHLFSDLALHDMGRDLADGVSQGDAGGADFRTAPLWGLSQRLFLLHDGRTKNLVEAINLHGGEAQLTVDNFKSLPLARRQALIDFLRSL